MRFDIAHAIWIPEDDMGDEDEAWEPEEDMNLDKDVYEEDV